MRSSSGTVSFTGTMLNTDQTQAITTESGTNGNWNLVGNPFPSYLNMTDDSGDATNNFLTANGICSRKWSICRRLRMGWI